MKPKFRIHGRQAILSAICLSFCAAHAAEVVKDNNTNALNLTTS